MNEITGTFTQGNKMESYRKKLLVNSHYRETKVEAFQ